MRRRRGITLIEVLVAIFIMAIGLLAILTLFPLGALRMGEALQDDRTGSSASAGANVCDAFGIRTDPAFYNPTANPPVNWFLAPPGLPPAAQNGSGYPVYVDPWGVSIGSGPVGGLIPRGAPSMIPGYTTASTPSVQQRYFTLLDDLTFFTNGAPDTSSGIQRFGRYTWAYLLHRSQPASPTSLVDLTVVVYAARSTSSLGENTFTAAGNANDTNVSLSWTPPGQAAPNIKRGGWILDTTIDKDSNGVILGVHGLFYRVVSVTQPSNTVMNLEVQVPLVKGVNSITVLDNVADVSRVGPTHRPSGNFATSSRGGVAPPLGLADKTVGQVANLPLIGRLLTCL